MSHGPAERHVRPNDHLVEPVFAALEVECARAHDPAEPAAVEAADGAPGPWWRRVLASLRGGRT